MPKVFKISGDSSVQVTPVCIDTDNGSVVIGKGSPVEMSLDDLIAMLGSIDVGTAKVVSDAGNHLVGQTIQAFAADHANRIFNIEDAIDIEAHGDSDMPAGTVQEVLEDLSARIKALETGS